MISAAKYGVSFSLKQCRNFAIDPHKCLNWLIAKGWRRFRLMSYWNEHEKEQGNYDFTELDWQLQRIARAKGVITLSLGVKQPRWPEYHWPAWALSLSPEERTAALLAYIEKVVQHVKNRPEIISYQLENEALLQGFGRNIDINRRRLRDEFDLVRSLDPTRLIIMSTSNGWGIPLSRPIPDVIGFSLYTIMHKNGRYTETIQRPWLHRLRRRLIRLTTRRPVFIHELQCEPWGPTAIWKMSAEEQDKSMSTQLIRSNIAAAQAIHAYPIDLWGAEWWYWRAVKHDDRSVWNALQKEFDGLH